MAGCLRRVGFFILTDDSLPGFVLLHTEGISELCHIHLFFNALFPVFIKITQT